MDLICIENGFNLYFELKTFLFSSYKKVAGVFFFRFSCIRTKDKDGTVIIM